MTGVDWRHLYPADSPTLMGGLNAAKRLLAAHPGPAGRIDLHVSASVGKDFLEPSVASAVAAGLGLGPWVKNLDLGSACLGFVDGLELSARLIESGDLDYALITAGENSRLLLESTLSRLLSKETTVRDFFVNFASLTLGSGGAAMLVGPSRLHPGSPKIRAAISLSDASSNDLCRGDFTGMTTDPAKLLTAGVRLAEEVFKEGQKAYGWRGETFDSIVCHQVSRANTDRLAQALKLPPERIFKTYPDYGNMGPVAVPFGFSLAMETGFIRPGQKVALMGIGSGLSCSMLELDAP
jgi:3-oxoacyl-[acyl-carrier-protein] synthase-3